MPAELLPARADPLKAVPAVAAPGEARHRSCGQATEVSSGRARTSAPTPKRCRSFPGSPAQDQVVCLCQAAVCGTGGGAGLPGPLTHRVASAGRLAGAVLADDAERLATLDLERDVLQRPELLVAGRVGPAAQRPSGTGCARGTGESAWTPGPRRSPRRPRLQLLGESRREPSEHPQPEQRA